MAHDGNGNVLLFGGSDANGTLLADTWRFDGTNWTQLANGTSARYYADMVLDTLPDLGAGPRNEVLLIGGSNGTVDRFNGTTWVTEPGITVTTGTTFATAATDTVRDMVLVADPLVGVSASNPLRVVGSTYTGFGVECGCQANPLTVTGTNTPRFGGNFTLNLTGPPNSLLYLGFDPIAAVPGFALPAPFPGGCLRYVGNAAGAAGAVGPALDPTGNGSWTFAVPNNQSFIGYRVHYQALLLGGPWCASAGLEVRIGF